LLGSGVRAIQFQGDWVSTLQLRDGTTIDADFYISPVPFDRLLGLLPEDIIHRGGFFGHLVNIDTSPITSVHIWYDRPVLKLPHVVLVDCVSQWIFQRGEVSPGNIICKWSSAPRANCERWTRRDRGPRHRRTGTYFPRPRAGCDQTRARHHGACGDLQRGSGRGSLAATAKDANSQPVRGRDWTATGWPATMEGAVRSGYLAAEALLHRHGQSETFTSTRPRR